MTQVDFYFNAADKYRLAASLSSKALAQAVRLFVFTPDDKVTLHMESVLWSFQQTSFIPHCRSQHFLAHETPVIVDHETEPLIHDDVLLNLCTTHPPFFSRFRRLIEIVGNDEADKAAARERFKFYRDRGYEISRHDLAGKA
ncbi:MAG: DNA polymerase III subunit chi [Methylophilales bacterium]|nr:DNA polymerase III subunit chi [Methylophilales bacterium]